MSRAYAVLTPTHHRLSAAAVTGLESDLAPLIGPPPVAYRSWINLKQLVRDRHGPTASGSLPAMLDTFGLRFVGRHHRGIDDCRNIVAVVRAWKAADAPLAITGHLSS